jgi:PrgI family protein
VLILLSDKIGYLIPPSLKHEEKIFSGLTRRQLVYLVAGIVLCAAVIKLTAGFAIYGDTYKFVLVIILCSIITISLLICEMRLDDWFKTINQYVRRGKRIHRFDKEMSNFIPLNDIEHDHYYNVYGDACTILKMYTLTGNRGDAKNADTIRDRDTDFINSLPCPIQILGYSSVFDIDKYTSMIMNATQLLSDDQQKLMIGHLNHIEGYCKDNNIKDKDLYMVIKTPINTLNQIERLNIDTNIIIKGLSECFVIGDRLTGTALTNTILMMSCGVGRHGVDYLSDCVTLEEI